MSDSQTADVTWALPLPDRGVVAAEVTELVAELEDIASEAVVARTEDIALCVAVRDARFPRLCQLHQGLRDALFLEIPEELKSWVEGMANGATRAPEVSHRLVDLARTHKGDTSGDDTVAQCALAELLLFEAIRLRLLISAWSNELFETVGGEETDIDEIAWTEVEALLREPALEEPGVRALPVMLAAATVSLARDAADRVDALRRVGEEHREELRMRARLRAALRELRLPEAVLLENALSTLLGEPRLDLGELQAARPVALAGMSRQAMDQRVSRGRRALARPNESWPKRRAPALFDLLRRAR